MGILTASTKENTDIRDIHVDPNKRKTLDKATFTSEQMQ